MHTAWTTSRALSIGVDAGNPVFEFGRVANAVKLSDGRIAVADLGNVEVRVFHADGTHDRSIGRRGNGPGEFTFLSRLALGAGDTLIAGGTSRMARYTADGVYVDERRLAWTDVDQAPYHVETAWALRSGAFLLMLLETSAGQPAEMPLHRPRRMYLVARPESPDVDTLGRFLGAEQLSYRDGGETHTALPLFFATTQVSVASTYLTIGDMGSDSVLRYVIDTGERSWIKLPLERQPIPAAVLAATAAQACNWTTSAEARERCEISLRHLPTQSEYPVFNDLAVDSMGRIWARTYRAAVDPNEAEWLVIGESGQTIAKTALPSNLRLAQIGAAYILGIARDSLGVERVQEFTIRR